MLPLSDLVTWVLLPIVIYFLNALLKKIDNIDSKVTQLLINDGIRESEIEEINRRLTAIEKKVFNES